MYFKFFKPQSAAERKAPAGITLRALFGLPRTAVPF